MLIERKLSDCIRFYRMAKVLFLPPANLVFQKRNSKFDRYRERIYFTAAAYLIYQNIRVKSHLQIIVKALFHYRNPFVGILKILTLKKRAKNVSKVFENTNDTVIHKHFLKRSKFYRSPVSLFGIA